MVCGTAATPQISLHLKFNHSTEYDEVMQQGSGEERCCSGETDGVLWRWQVFIKVQGESL